MAHIDTRSGIQASYTRVRHGIVSQTMEIEPGRVIADFDDAGRLLGIETLGPAEVTVQTLENDSFRFPSGE